MCGSGKNRRRLVGFVEFSRVVIRENRSRCFLYQCFQPVSVVGKPTTIAFGVGLTGRLWLKLLEESAMKTILRLFAAFSTQNGWRSVRFRNYNSFNQNQLQPVVLDG